MENQNVKIPGFESILEDSVWYSKDEWKWKYLDKSLVNLWGISSREFYSSRMIVLVVTDEIEYQLLI